VRCRPAWTWPGFILGGAWPFSILHQKHTENANLVLATVNVCQVTTCSERVSAAKDRRGVARTMPAPIPREMHTITEQSFDRLSRVPFLGWVGANTNMREGA
jgi:hypothetical protein